MQQGLNTALPLISVPALTAVLHDEIPVTRAMGIRAVEVTDDAVTLFAPLETNLNHKCTAFGGSLYSVAVLTGWSLIYSQLRRYAMEAHIVIQESHIQFLEPVTSDLVSICQAGGGDVFERFLEQYRRKGKARIALDVTVGESHSPGVTFHGKYVIHTR